MAPKSTTATPPGTKYPDVYHHVDLKTLPSFAKLQTQVQEVVKASSWWQLYGVDWAHIVVATFGLLPLGLWCLCHNTVLYHILGIVLLGTYHGTLANKAGHVLSHGGLAKSQTVNAFMFHTCVNFVGAFSSKVATSIHIKYHHPHTNVIGLGDSSTWRAPFFSRLPYLILVPLTIPILTPLVALLQIVEQRDFREFFVWSTLSASGATFHIWLMIHFCGFTVFQAVVYLLIYRALLGIPFIHVNIFQHIGLPMFSPENRPGSRIYQMSQGCLNLSSNTYLNATFGHSLISCHVEHHLFPKLSDNMCLQVKPLVRRYLLENGLQYHEQSYWDRFKLFWNEYDRLMVDAPPITHFVGIQ